MSLNFGQNIKEGRSLLWTAVPPAIGLVLVALICRTFQFLGLAPDHIGTGVEDIVIHHQHTTASKPYPAKLLFIGDSTCLMDLDLSSWPATGDAGPLNLGLMSTLPLSAFAEVASEFSKSNPDYPLSIVLLISPAMLEQEVTPLAPSATNNLGNGFLNFSGLGIVRDAIHRIVPTPLPGRYGRYYGFDQGLEQFLKSHGGSAVDPGELARPGKNTSRVEISESFRQHCVGFRAKFPRGCKLFVGLAPVPRETFDSDLAHHHQELASELQKLVGADHALRLPARYPGLLFASPTHLKPQVRSRYTRAVWNAVQAARNSDASTNSIPIN